MYIDKFGMITTSCLLLAINNAEKHPLKFIFKTQTFCSRQTNLQSKYETYCAWW